jgi:2,3-bisphosphoglycerate-independent phosphoglycerate mutase
LFFVDGVGIGENDRTFNPCCYSKTGIFNVEEKGLPLNGRRYAIDAQLGVAGLPQSASGHTTLYTGINAAAHIGKHLYGFPNSALRLLLRNRSVFVKLIAEGYKCRFINAFRPVFFTTPEIFDNLHMSATTEMNKYANLPFSDFQQIINKQALYHDYTNEEVKLKGFDLPLFSAQQAADILVQESHKYDLLLYEYFMTDFAGHSKDLARAIKEIRKVEDLIIALVKTIDFSDTSLIVVSDHGNIEDMRVKSHTSNPAFMAIWPARPLQQTFNFKSLMDIYPFILQTLTAA